MLQGSHAGGGKRCCLLWHSREKEPSESSVQLACSARPCLHWCTNLSNVTLLCFGYNSHQWPVEQKSSILPRRCRLLPLFLSFRLKFWLFRVAFICIRVEVVSSSSSCHSFSVNPIPLDVMGRCIVGLTSSFSFFLRKRKEFLMFISNDLPYESGLETHDNLIP